MNRRIAKSPEEQLGESWLLRFGAHALAALASCGAITACGASAMDSESPEYGQTASALVTYQVGPGKSYATLSSIATLLKPGDVVEVYGGTTYAGGVRFTKPGTATSKITIRGVSVGGARPRVSGGTTGIEFGASHYVFENFEVTGASTRCVYHHADDVTIRKSVVHDCAAHGILGADTSSGSLLLDQVEVYRSGSGTNLHQIYIATDETAYPHSVFRMQNCYVHDGLGGINVKSRAERNEIYYNWIEGAYYYELDLIGPDGQAESLAREDSDVIGNVLFQGYGTRNHSPIRMGGDGTGQTFGRYRFVNNTLVLGAATAGAAFRAADGIESVEMHNNVLYRQGGGPVNVLRDVEAVWKSGRVVGGTKNWLPSASSSVPATWSGTRAGASPGFVDVTNRNLHLLSGSALKDAGNPAPTSPSGYAFPNPLPYPKGEPPPHVILAAPSVRTVVTAIDIGAYELASTTTNTTSAPVAQSVVAPVASGTPVALAPVADAYVEQGDQANKNFGASTQLFSATTATGAYTRETYLRFDLTSAPQVGSAKLRLSAALTSTANGALAMSAYSVSSGTWTELGLTWNNKPLRNATALSSVSVSSLSYVAYELDVTSFVKAEKAAGRTSVTLVLHDPSATSARVLMQSRETSSGPRLVVSP